MPFNSLKEKDMAINRFKTFIGMYYAYSLDKSL